MTSDVLFRVQHPPGDPRRHFARTFSESAPDIPHNAVQPGVLSPASSHHVTAATGDGTPPRASDAAAETRRRGCERVGCPPCPPVLHECGLSAHNSLQAHPTTTYGVVEPDQAPRRSSEAVPGRRSTTAEAVPACPMRLTARGVSATPAAASLVLLRKSSAIGNQGKPPGALAVRPQPPQLLLPASPTAPLAFPTVVRQPAALPDSTPTVDKNATSPSAAPRPPRSSFNSPPSCADAPGHHRSRVAAQGPMDSAVCRALFAAVSPLVGDFASPVPVSCPVTPAIMASISAAFATPSPFELRRTRSHAPRPLTFWACRALFRMVDIRYACSRSRPPKGHRLCSLLAVAAAAACFACFA